MDIHLVQKLLGLRWQNRNPALSSTYFIWFIKQACESEVLLCSTHVYHWFLQRAKYSCPHTLMGSMAILLHQMLLALKPGPHRVREKARIQHAPSWALSLHCTSSRGICPSFLSSHLPPHTSPAVPPIRLLDLWHTTNCSKLSFPQGIPSVRQHFNKAVHRKNNVLRRRY